MLRAYKVLGWGECDLPEGSSNTPCMQGILAYKFHHFCEKLSVSYVPYIL